VWWGYLANSGLHHKALTVVFSVQPLGFTKGLLVPERGVADAGELVGQRTGGLVVVGSTLNTQCPAALIRPILCSASAFARW
jgi:hypothetical protein